MVLQRNRRFWDEKARENPWWYVSSFSEYGKTDLNDFWASGYQIWEELKSVTGYVPRTEDVVVEIGCGVGRLTRAIAADVFRVHAQDISEEMLRIAMSQNLANAKFHHGDGESLAGIDDNCASFVVAYNVFQHLPSVRVLSGYLQEMIRVAKNDSIIAFTLAVRGWTFPLLPLLRLRRFLLERAGVGGPKGLYRHEWVGIRPGVEQVRKVSRLPLTVSVLHGNKRLFFGRTPQAARGEVSRAA